MKKTAYKEPPREIEAEESLPLSQIDERLASMVAEAPATALQVQISFEPSTGIAKVKIAPSREHIDEPSIDFELSASECAGLDEASLGDFIGKPVETSSAYEFFDFASACCTRLRCLVEFTGNAWRIEVKKIEGGEG